MIRKIFLLKMKSIPKLNSLVLKIVPVIGTNKLIKANNSTNKRLNVPKQLRHKSPFIVVDLALIIFKKPKIRAAILKRASKC